MPEYHEGKLEAKVISGRGFPIIDRFTKRDTYVELTIDTLTKKTLVDHKSGNNPVWNDTIVFDISGPGKNSMLIKLKEPGRQNTEVCSGIIDLRKAYKEEEVDDWYPLTKKNKPAGSIYIEFTFTPKGGRKNPTKVQQMSELSLVPPIAPPIQSSPSVNASAPITIPITPNGIPPSQQLAEKIEMISITNKIPKNNRKSSHHSPSITQTKLNQKVSYGASMGPNKNPSVPDFSLQYALANGKKPLPRKPIAESLCYDETVVQYSTNYQDPRFFQNSSAIFYQNNFPDTNYSGNMVHGQKHAYHDVNNNSFENTNTYSKNSYSRRHSTTSILPVNDTLISTPNMNHSGIFAQTSQHSNPRINSKVSSSAINNYFDHNQANSHHYNISNNSYYTPNNDHVNAEYQTDIDPRNSSHVGNNSFFYNQEIAQDSFNHTEYIPHPGYDNNRNYNHFNSHPDFASHNDLRENQYQGDVIDPSYTDFRFQQTTENDHAGYNPGSLPSKALPIPPKRFANNQRPNTSQKARPKSYTSPSHSYHSSARSSYIPPPPSSRLPPPPPNRKTSSSFLANQNTNSQLPLNQHHTQPSSYEPSQVFVNSNHTSSYNSRSNSFTDHRDNIELANQTNFNTSSPYQKPRPLPNIPAKNNSNFAEDLQNPFLYVDNDSVCNSSPNNGFNNVGYEDSGYYQDDMFSGMSGFPIQPPNQNYTDTMIQPSAPSLPLSYDNNQNQYFTQYDDEEYYYEDVENGENIQPHNYQNMNQSHPQYTQGSQYYNGNDTGGNSRYHNNVNESVENRRQNDTRYDGANKGNRNVSGISTPRSISSGKLYHVQY
ncbi:hypothetical protein BB558_005391 [Smittium angustum]|uniref:C2 domain-containing protein n=1 Tax=Smittium angustum TaxID=133377 RepID=A0A2U1J0K6_SMIAN|nr:hypothetical protein BB558_005391 [Smittium angustum]